MKKSVHNYAVILAGGSGSRFWPLSRSLEPKQFLSLHSARSLFHDTLSRIKTIVPSQNILIVTNQLYFPGIFNYTSEFNIPRSNFIFEPEGKNTAASIAVAARLISLVEPGARMAVFPPDHLIKNIKGFRKLLRSAFSFIPLGKAHRLENPASSPLRIIEVQSGDYPEEDDIIGLKDDFERA